MHIPKFGTIVVNGYDAIFGFALVILSNKVDLPAFGTPIKPISAIKFNSNFKTFFSPLSGDIHTDFSFLFLFLFAPLPIPPLPPFAIIILS